MAKKTAKPKRQRISKEDREVYNDVVFQDGRVLQGPLDMGFFELTTMNNTFVVVINASSAEFLIDQLQQFLKGRAPHFARNQN